MKKIIRITLAFILIFVLAAGLCACFKDETKPVPDNDPDFVFEGDAPFEIYCFDAGNADAFLIMTENHTVVLDAGVKGFGKTILSYLADNDRPSVDSMIITHFDKDHVGGAAKIINSIPVENVFQSNYIRESTEYEKYIKALASSEISPITVRKTYTFEYDGAKFTIDPPTEENYTNDPSNNSSLIVTIEYGNRVFLFTGDAENDRMADFIVKGAASDCDVIKIPHHGKWDKNLTELIASTSPEFAVITSSVDEPEDVKTLELLDSKGIKVFLTKKAPVMILCDGVHLAVDYETEWTVGQ